MEEGELQDLLGELLGLFLRGWADFQFFSIMKNMSIMETAWKHLTYLFVWNFPSEYLVLFVSVSMSHLQIHMYAMYHVYLVYL